MAAVTSPLIGVVVCSSRNPRVCPQVAAFVMDTLKSSAAPPPVNLQIIDLAAWNLPMFDEPHVPETIANSADYAHPHTRAWSEEVKKYAGFIFVTPQYNWGYPAVLKNAIDFLYNEWHGKAAMIVSYGGHGGGKGAAQLRQVLNGVRMQVPETMPALAFPSKKELVLAATGKSLNLLEEGSIWEAEKESIRKAFEELVPLLSM